VEVGYEGVEAVKEKGDSKVYFLALFENQSGIKMIEL
jgi:hypothetical protein